MKVPGKQSKSKQYIIGGVVAVVILFMWISIPMMSNSSLDSSVSGSPFKSRPADLNSLGGGIPEDGSAPGYALNGSMIDNPATSGEMIASSLFQMGPSDTETPGLEDSTAAGGVSGGVSSGGGAFSGGPAGYKGGGGKLNKLGSIGGGNAGSMSVGGGKHEKFFGGGNAKADLAPLTNQDMKGPGTDKKNASLAMLQNSEAKSTKAAQAKMSVGARSGAASAFESAKGKAAGLETAMESTASGAGISGSGESAASDLKNSDPKMNKPTFTPPKPKPEKDKTDENEEFKKMLIQMLIQSLLGPIFSNMASSLFAPTGGA